MNSWRGTTPQPVQDDLDALVARALDKAEELLKEHREFFPFGVIMTRDGTEGLFYAESGSGEQASAQRSIDLLYEGAADLRSTYRAFAVVADVEFNGTDAVLVQTEHRDGGPALDVAMPYQFTGFRKKTFAYGQIAAAERERRVWAD